MKTRKDIVTRCKELGVEIEDTGFVIELIAPDGHCFAGTFLHIICLSYNHGAYSMPEIWAMAWDDLKMGTIPCDCEDCRNS